MFFERGQIISFLNLIRMHAVCVSDYLASWSDKCNSTLNLRSYRSEDRRVERKESGGGFCSWSIYGEYAHAMMGEEILLILVHLKPTCHAKHLPTFVEKYAEFKAKGVDVIAVLAVNDAFVMSGWLRFSGVKDEVGHEFSIFVYMMRIKFHPPRF